MSAADTLTPLLSTPWTDVEGEILPVRALPGLRSEAITTLASACPGVFNRVLQRVLAASCGLADTQLGLVDFSGSSHPDETCGVFQPCLTLAVDGSGRRWIAECGGQDLPGPIWCVFPDPEVAVYVCDDLSAFVTMLWQHARSRDSDAWLQALTVTAHAIWTHRRALALRPHHAFRVDSEIRGWLSTLPSDAYVYDLRAQQAVRAWPYGVAGPSGRLFRCGRRLVFAVSGPPANGSRMVRPPIAKPHEPLTGVGLDRWSSLASTGRRWPLVTAQSAAARRSANRALRRLRHRSGGPRTKLPACAVGACG